jgi:hypothetical protein
VSADGGPVNPDQDPIVLAGSLTCGCGLVCWPTQAAQVGGGLILAEFEDHGYATGCQARRGARVVLVDLDAEDQAVPAVIRPRHCRATAATTGRQCRSPARPGSAYCGRHDPELRAVQR